MLSWLNPFCVCGASWLRKVLPALAAALSAFVLLTSCIERAPCSRRSFWARVSFSYRKGAIFHDMACYASALTFCSASSIQMCHEEGPMNATHHGRSHVDICSILTVSFPACRTHADDQQLLEDVPSCSVQRGGLTSPSLYLNSGIGSDIRESMICALKAQPSTADDMVIAIVENIRGGGVCQAFRDIFNTKSL